MPYFENARVITASGSTFNYVGGNQFALRHTVATDQEQLDPDIELEHHDPSHIFQREELLGGIRQGDSMGFHGVDDLTDSVLTTNDVAVHDARLASHIRAEDEADKIPNIPSDVDDFPESPISVALEHARPASSGPGDDQIPAEHGVYPCEHVAIHFQYSTTSGTTDPRPTFGFGDNPQEADTSQLTRTIRANVSHSIPNGPTSNPVTFASRNVFVNFISRSLGHTYLYLLLYLPLHYSSKAHAVLANVDASGLALSNLEQSWADYLKTLLDDWNRLWYISVMLIPASAAVVFQPAVNNPITRTGAFPSVECAFVGLLSAKILLDHFDAFALRSVDQASRWTVEARMSEPLAAWNAWVLLAMPAVWTRW